ncbi:MAG: SGNH/GDSL hydrolase family protein [Chitinophagales bacterium]|nr:SGNH/GDSL hydrolase family protein [Chitinophagales bacterium]
MAVVNPADFPKAVNVCNKAENYYYTYLLLKSVLNNNSTIKHVIIPCSYDNFSVSQEEKMFDLINKYELLISVGDLMKNKTLNSVKAIVHKILPFDFENTLKTLIFHRLKPLPQDAIPYFGKYYYSEKSNLDTALMIESIAGGYYGNLGQYRSSGLFKDCFIKILELCRQKNVRLILVNTPYHPYYLSKIPADAIRDFQKFALNEIGKRRNVKYLDVTTMNFADSSYGDGHHVNAKGAKLLADTICRFADL